MGYCHIELSDSSKELCTITTQWGKYECQGLPMGLCNSPDIFQEKMNDLLDGLDTARVYIDDILHVTKGSWEDHLEELEEVFRRLQQAGLKVNAKKSDLGAEEMEYLGHSVWCSKNSAQTSNTLRRTQRRRRCSVTSRNRG
jgi:hypothetical protein